MHAAQCVVMSQTTFGSRFLHPHDILHQAHDVVYQVPRDVDIVLMIVLMTSSPHNDDT